MQKASKLATKITKRVAKNADASLTNKNGRPAKVAQNAKSSQTGTQRKRKHIEQEITEVEQIVEEAQADTRVNQTRSGMKCIRATSVDCKTKGKTKTNLSSVEFEENNNFVSMEVSGHLSDDQFDSDAEDGELCPHSPDMESQNQSSQATGSSVYSHSEADRNRTVDLDSATDSAQNSGRDSSPEPGPSMAQQNRQSAKENNKTRQSSNKEDDTLELMQKFMIKKGLLDRSMTAEQMRKYVEDDNSTTDSKNNTNDNNTRHELNSGRHDLRQNGNVESNSDVTVYKMQ